MLDTIYATDEDVYVIGASDFGVVAPRSARVAYGTDGSFGPSGWVFTSASNDFSAQGVAAGMVVKVESGVYVPPQYLAVETVAATTLTLRRCGLPTGTGMPPGPTSGTSQVTFEVATLQPQIEDAAYTMHQRFGVDPLLPNYRPSDIYDSRPFRRLTIFYVLWHRYTDLTRTDQGDFKLKADFYRLRFEEELAIVTVRWGPTGDLNPPTNKFGMRISR